MSIESVSPQDNKPNLEHEIDIMRRLLDEQAIIDGERSEMNKMSRGTGVIEELNEKIRNRVVRVLLHSSIVAIRFENDPELVKAYDSSEKGQQVAGEIGLIDFGEFESVWTYFVCLVDPRMKHKNPLLPDSEPFHMSIVAPVAHILDYAYLSNDER